MPDALNASFEAPAPVDGWLLALDGDPCGADLEYDAEYLELATAAAGKPESQFAAAEPPDWTRVREISESLFGRTRDLRVALQWGRARLNLDGFAALPATLALLHGLLDRFWDNLHPMPDPDDGDTFARLSVVGGLDKLDSLLGDVRQSLLLNDRRLGGLRVRDVEIALDKLAPRPDEEVRTQGQIAGLLADAPELAQTLAEQTAAALHWVKQLQSLIGERFSLDMGVDMKTLRGMLTGIQSVLPQAPDAQAEDGSDAAPGEGGAPGGRRGGGVLSVDSRQEAIRAIELICAYLERSEPTNPAQLLLRRASRLIDKNFLQLVRDLAPDAVSEVARIMGIDPSTLTDEN